MNLTRSGQKMCVVWLYPRQEKNLPLRIGPEVSAVASSPDFRYKGAKSKGSLSGPQGPQRTIYEIKYSTLPLIYLPP